MQAGIIDLTPFGYTVRQRSFWIMTRMENLLKKWIPELKERTNAEIAHVEKYRIEGYCSPVVDLSIRSKEMNQSFRNSESARGRRLPKKSWQNTDQENPFRTGKEKVKKTIK